MSTIMVLSPKENIVYDVILDYMDNNRTFNPDKIIPYIRNILSRNSANINEKGIKNILEKLIKKKLIIQGSKLTKTMVLDNVNRIKIYEFIKKNPGFYFNRLLKRLKMPNHVISWHLNILLNFGFVKKVKIDKHEVYFHPKVDPSDYQAYYTLSKSKSQRILSFYKGKNNGLTKSSIAKKLGIHYNTVSKYVNLLKMQGILIEKKMLNKTLYSLNRSYLNSLYKYHFS